MQSFFEYPLHFRKILSILKLLPGKQVEILYESVAVKRTYIRSYLRGRNRRDKPLDDSEKAERRKRQVEISEQHRLHIDCVNQSEGNLISY